MRSVIQEPKTEKGIRFVLMSDEVAERFRRVIARRPAPESEPEVDGLSGFLCLDKNGMPLVALHWGHYFQRIVAKSNSIYREEIPKMTPHVCRHTFCSNYVADGSGLRPAARDRRGRVRDVADPWYTGNFDDTYRDVLAGCRGLLAALS